MYSHDVCESDPAKSGFTTLLYYLTFLHGQWINDAVCTLACLIKGNSTWFKVKPTGSIDIVDLRKLIWEEGKNGVLRGVLAKDLTLCHVLKCMLSYFLLPSWRISRILWASVTLKRTHSDTSKNGWQCGKHKYHNCQVVNAFTQAGYTLGLNNKDKNGWGCWVLLNKVKQPSMCCLLT